MTTYAAPASFGFGESKKTLNAKGASEANIRAHVSRSFAMYDTNAKGFLDRDDLKCAFASLTGSVPSKREVRHVFDQCSHGDQVGEIRGLPWHVFGKYMEERLASESSNGETHFARCERARSVFRAFDVTKAGYLTMEDTLRAFKTAVPGVSPEIVADVFREADVDSDGKVGAEAFEKLFTAGSLPR
jgi:Ca2+-binding EF-hand superfamily protein|tara:strand:- start:9624 stop:10184 length:561 start_codon:yes stop_codon:yes gene_type:complete